MLEKAAQLAGVAARYERGAELDREAIEIYRAQG